MSQKKKHRQKMVGLHALPGALPYKPINDVPFFRVSFFSINSREPGMKIDQTGYDYLFKNNWLLFSRTIDYCFPIAFGIFCNLIISKQGIKMQIFVSYGWVVEVVKNGHLSVKLHSNAPPRMRLHMLIRIFADHNDKTLPSPRTSFGTDL